MPLEHFQEFVAAEKHLPNVTSAAEMDAANGMDLHSFVCTLLEKVEESMLYILQLHKQLRESEQQVQRLTGISSDQKQTVARLEAQLDNLLAERLLGFEARLQQLEAQRQSDSRRLEQ